MAIDEDECPLAQAAIAVRLMREAAYRLDLAGTRIGVSSLKAALAEWTPQPEQDCLRK